MTDAELRRWAFETALAQSPGGTRWANIFDLAELFCTYVKDGTYVKKGVK